MRRERKRSRYDPADDDQFGGKIAKLFLDTVPPEDVVRCQMAYDNSLLDIPGAPPSSSMFPVGLLLCVLNTIFAHGDGVQILRWVGARRCCPESMPLSACTSVVTFLASGFVVTHPLVIGPSRVSLSCCVSPAYNTASTAVAFSFEPFLIAAPEV